MAITAEVEDHYSIIISVHFDRTEPGGSYLLNCSVVGLSDSNNTTIIWTKPDNTTTETTEQIFLVLDVSGADVGNYTCTVEFGNMTVVTKEYDFNPQSGML